MNFTVSGVHRVAAAAMVVAAIGCSQQQEATQPEKSPQKAAVPAAVALNGQVFVVTKGRDNIKLALVMVYAVDESTVAKSLSPVAREWSARVGAAMTDHSNALAEIKSAPNAASRAAAKKRADDALDRFMKIETPMRKVIAALPPSTPAAKTDADGRFSLSLTPGQRYLLVASTERQAAGARENLDWLVWVTPTEGVPTNLMLSNDNLVDSYCGECANMKRLAESPARL